MKQKKVAGVIRYIIHNGVITKCTLATQPKRGGSWYCKIDGFDDLVLIRNDRLYKTERLENAINAQIEANRKTHEASNKEVKEIENIIWKILEEFDVKIPLIDWSCMTKEEVEKIYNDIKTKNLNEEMRVG